MSDHNVEAHVERLEKQANRLERSIANIERVEDFKALIKLQREIIETQRLYIGRLEQTRADLRSMVDYYRDGFK